MSTIYQVSSIVSPVFGGFVVSSVGISAACVFFAVWSLVSLATKAVLLRLVYFTVPLLAERDVYKVSVVDASSDKSKPASKRSPLLEYVSHTVFPAAFGLALLYITVFEYDALVIGYVESRGLTANIVGTFGSVSAVFGLLGSFLYSFLQNHISTKRAGLVGVTCYFLAVSPCIVSLFLPGGLFSHTASHTAVFVYLGGVCLGIPQKRCFRSPKRVLSALRRRQEPSNHLHTRKFHVSVDDPRFLGFAYRR
ncbi:hypothetical protein L596_019926 [Steinernema carpocapsae]|uniref:Solute carrier family 40 member n=1 Tax=Steinernema carpocapsae TaxID=34508 RepID=A0A4U5MS39_STECR|nr:hypothetical protein L596_019926 [Steinernema carpocapsae]